MIGQDVELVAVGASSASWTTSSAQHQWTDRGGRNHGEASAGDEDWLKSKKVHMPSPGLRMKEYDSKANRLKRA